MEIIKIERTTMGEVAYVYSEGRILKLPVEDLTGYDYEPEYEEPVRRPKARKIIPRRPAPAETVERIFEPQESLRPGDEGYDPEADPNLQGLPIKKPNQNPRSMMPAQIRSVFMPAGAPGAAVESRTV